mmetsp:Transcript_37861/g.100791  ORF Transcript_37861/g.100791 Transcript_37861/m.100791 type:complete len:210 (+) Transcript_37861:703-1332(+)
METVASTLTAPDIVRESDVQRTQWTLHMVHRCKKVLQLHHADLHGSDVCPGDALARLHICPTIHSHASADESTSNAEYLCRHHGCTCNTKKLRVSNHVAHRLSRAFRHCCRRQAHIHHLSDVCALRSHAVVATCLGGFSASRCGADGKLRLAPGLQQLSSHVGVPSVLRQLLSEIILDVLVGDLVTSVGHSASEGRSDPKTQTQRRQGE